jgi:hypothetical protein
VERLQFPLPWLVVQLHCLIVKKLNFKNAFLIKTILFIFLPAGNIGKPFKKSNYHE